jgi:hypothetical protein
MTTKTAARITLAYALRRPRPALPDHARRRAFAAARDFDRRAGWHPWHSTRSLFLHSPARPGRRHD